MSKFNITVVAVIFAVLGGCTNMGEMVGTGHSETNNPTQPYPIGSLIQSDD